MENWEKQLKFIKVKSDGYIYDGNGDVIAKLAEGRTSNFYNAIDAELESARRKERERIGGIITPILERHKNWKPAFRGESEEECGFQKGLIDEARLLSQDILDSLHQNNEQGGK